MTFAPAYSPDLTGIVVLIVDDNADSLDVLSLALERFGAIVQTAANARDALAKALAMRPHVIVSDLSMPDEDGLWLVDQLKHRQHGGGIPTVAAAFRRSPSRLIGAGTTCSRPPTWGSTRS